MITRSPSPQAMIASEVGLVELNLYGKGEPRLHVRPESIYAVEPSRGEFAAGADVHIDGLGCREVLDQPARVLFLMQRAHRAAISPELAGRLPA